MTVREGRLTLKQCDLDKKTQAKEMNVLTLRTVNKEKSRMFRWDVCDACLPELRRILGDGEEMQMYTSRTK